MLLNSIGMGCKIDNMTNWDISGLKDSLEILRRNSDLPGQLKTLAQLGQVHQADRRYREALNYCNQALDLARDRGSCENQTLALANLGCVFWEMAQLKKAMTHFEEALSITEETGDGEGRSQLLVIMGISYWRKGEWDEAIDCFEGALQVSPKPEIDSDLLPPGDSGKYDGLQGAMERGVATLKNRIRIARGHDDPARILLPSFSMVPLLYFTGQKGEIPALLDEIVLLARKLKNQNMLDTLPKLQKLMEIG